MEHNISKALATQIAGELEAAANEILERHGLAVQKRTWKYGYKFAMTIEGQVPQVNDNGVDVSSDEAQNWIGLGGLYFPQIPEDANLAAWLGLEIESRGNTYQFIGLNTRARTMPLQFRCVNDGKVYKFRESAVVMLIAAASKAGV